MKKIVFAFTILGIITIFISMQRNTNKDIVTNEEMVIKLAEVI